MSAFCGKFMQLKIAKLSTNVSRWDIILLFLCLGVGRMDIEDLRKFLAIARTNNLQRASEELSQTPGALSKSIKRLEEKFNQQLFSRSGRNIVLNRQGEKLRQYALSIVHEADQALSEFSGQKHKTQVNISGPSLLVQHWLPAFVRILPSQQFELNMRVDWEGAALRSLFEGQVHMALVTQNAISEMGSISDIKHIPLGETSHKVVASASHELFRCYPDGELNNKDLLDYVFACPEVSPIGGVKKGFGSDGWRDDKVPRNIGFRSNDFSLLMSLVQQGEALAYVPEIIAEQYGFRIINVLDCGYICKENFYLSYRPSLAFGWLNKFVGELETLQLQRYLS